MKHSSRAVTRPDTMAQPASSGPARDIYVARQSIYDASLNVVAYEVLYRGSRENRARITDGTKATSELLLNAVVEIGLERLVGQKLAFVNLTRDFLLGHHPLPLSDGQLVLEILEDVVVDHELVEGVERLVSNGYVLALDDAVFREELIPLLELASIVKVELPAIAPEALEEHVRLFRKYPVKLLAEKVETVEEFNRCRDLGFEFFQGFFLSRPQMVPGKRRSPVQMSVLKLLGRLSDPNVTVDELERLIKDDVALSYKLLRYINSARFALRTRIQSLRQVILLLGVHGIRTVSMLASLAGAVQKPGDLLKDATERAMMCEQLARLMPGTDVSGSFTAGLISSLDAVFDMPLDELLASLPLSEELKAAIVRREGLVGEILECAIAVERAQWDAIHCGELTPEEIRQAYLWAITEVNALWSSFDD